MRYDLKRPCKHCPFRSDETRITFACRERADDIQEHAYRRGFPCHESAVHVEAEDDPIGDGGFVPGPNTQHCAGFIIMQLKEATGSPWPGINNDDELLQKLEAQIDWDAPVFDDTDAFLDANTKPQGERFR